jgi:uncharacterized protein YbbC (DUF1343 family)
MLVPSAACNVLNLRCAGDRWPADGCMRWLPLFLALLIAPGATSRAESKTVVLNGIDVLREQNFAPLAGKRIGLITNQTGLAADGTPTIDLIHESEVCKLAALFSPEHGIRGNLDSRINSSTDESTGLPVHSLYGDTRRPTTEMLKGIDVLVFDIQDIGARFYTYITTMAYCMEEAAKAKIPFYVLDRPNPIGGLSVEGPMLDEDRTSFVGYMPLPVRHGMTVGELARYFNAEKRIGADLHVVELKGWRRSHYFFDTGLLWVNPSPNMRSLVAALFYPGVCLLEQTNVSVGRGTDRPFELVGAPWIEPRRFAAALDLAQVPGVKYVPLYFTPTAGTHQGSKCGGVSIVLIEPGKVDSVLLGLTMASVLNGLYPGEFKIDSMLDLLGNVEALKMLKAGRPPAEVLTSGDSDLREFLVKRQKILLYGPLPDPKEGNR